MGDNGHVCNKVMVWQTESGEKKIDDCTREELIACIEWQQIEIAKEKAMHRETLTLVQTTVDKLTRE